MEKFLRSSIKSMAKTYYNFVKPDAKKGDYLPPSGKVLGKEEMLNMIDATLDMWLTAGRFNDKFEKEFANYMGVKHALTVNSGSSANLLALSALTSPKLGDKRIKKGDEVITVAAGFPTTVNPIIQNGCIPVFVDVEMDTCNIDINQIKEALSKKTKAIFVAHTIGNVFELDKIKEICEKHNLWLIEDNCDALGSKYNNKLTGTFGHIGTFSFYPAHHITMGEGGSVITNDTKLYRILMSFRDWGRDCWCPPGKDNSCNKRFSYQLGNLPYGYDHKYTYSHLGYNLKISDWQAACGLAQLKKLDKYIIKRQENFQKLYQGLKQFEEYLLLPKTPHKAQPSWFGFVITVKENNKFKKLDLVKYLEENNVGTRQLFAGNILRQPAYVNNDDIEIRIRNSKTIKTSELKDKHYKMLPKTDEIMNATFWVGVWPRLKNKDIEYIINTFENFMNSKVY